MKSNKFVSNGVRLPFQKRTVARQMPKNLKGDFKRMSIPFVSYPRTNFRGGAVPTVHTFSEPPEGKIERRKMPFQRFTFVSIRQ